MSILFKKKKSIVLGFLFLNIIGIIYLFFNYIYVFYFYIGILLSIALHELGHFIFMKLFGVRVLEFSIGFGPKILTFYKDRSGTEYNLRAVLLGGFVKPLDDIVIKEYKKENKKNIKKWGYIKTLDTYLKGKGYNKDSLMIYKSLYKKILMLSGGVIMNIILAISSLFIFFHLKDSISNNVNYKNYNSYISHIETNLKYKKNYELKKYMEHKIGQSLWLGNRFYPDFEEKGFLQKIDIIIYETKQGILLSFYSLKYILNNPNNIIMLQSIVGIGKDIGIMEKYNLVNLAIIFFILSIINLSLAVFNILPIPVLDGGHIFKEIIYTIIKNLKNINLLNFDIFYWGYVEYIFFLFFTILGVGIIIKDIIF